MAGKESITLSRFSELGDDELESLLQAGFRYALSLCHHDADAEDLLQEALLACIKSHGPLNKAYLFSAIRSRFFNLNKRAQLVPMEPLKDYHLNGIDLAQEAAGDGVDWLESCLHQLRPLEREALFLSYIEGYTAEEIARLNKQNRNTVLSLIHRAKLKLKLAAKRLIARPGS